MRIRGDNYREGVGAVILHPDIPKRVMVGMRMPKGTQLEDKNWQHGPNWQLPQGGIEHGEGIIDCIRREVKKETTLGPRQVKIIRVLPETTSYVWNSSFRRDGNIGARHEWVVMRKFTADLPDATLAEEKEFMYFRWMDMDELITKCQHMRVPGYTAIKRMMGW